MAPALAYNTCLDDEGFQLIDDDSGSAEPDILGIAARAACPRGNQDQTCDCPRQSGDAALQPVPDDGLFFMNGIRDDLLPEGCTLTGLASKHAAGPMYSNLVSIA